MRYLTFQPEFHQPILDRVKVGTIRAHARVQVGERFALRRWSGVPYRSRMTTLAIAECVGVSRIVVAVLPGSAGEIACILDGHALGVRACEDMARAEGFASAVDMGQWFRSHGNLPFMGALTRWNPHTLEFSP